MSNDTFQAGRRRFSLRSGLILGVAASLLAVSACAPETDSAPEAASTPAAPEAVSESVVCPVVEMSVGTVVSATEPTAIVLESIAAGINERTGGTLTMKVFPDGQLGQNRDMQEQTVAGGAQIAQIDPGYAAELSGNPEFNIMGGPFLFDSVEDLNHFADSDIVAEWNDQMAADAGVHMLTWKFYFGERHIISNQGFPDVGDLEGIKIRVPPSPSWVETFTALPTTPTVLEWSEVYSGLDQGVVDAAEAPLSSMLGSSLYEVGDTVTLTGHFKAATGWFTNVDFWNSLPPECQEVVSEEFAKGSDEMTQITLDNEQILRDQFASEFGVTLVEPDVAGYKAAALPFYSAFPDWSPGLHDRVLEVLSTR